MTLHNNRTFRGPPPSRFGAVVLGALGIQGLRRRRAGRTRPASGGGPEPGTPAGRTTSVPPIVRASRWTRERAATVVIAGAGVYTLVLSTVSVAKYVTFTTEWDHAIFTQYLWLLGHGASPLNTLNGRFLLGDHIEPGLALLAPLGVVDGTAIALLVLQSIALALVAPILYTLGRHLGVDSWLSAVVPLLWLVSPAVVRPNLWEFHPETVAAPLIALSALAAVTERWRWFVVITIIACTFREDVALLYIGGGVLLFLHGRRRAGVALSSAAALWYATAVLVLIPSFGTALEEDYGPRFAGDRGDSVSDVLRFAIENPLQFLNETFDVANLGILAVLVLTTAGLCCLVPRWIVVPAPILFLNFASSYESQHTLRFQYFVLPAVAIAVAGVMGAKVLTRLDVGRRKPAAFRLGHRSSARVDQSRRDPIHGARRLIGSRLTRRPRGCPLGDPTGSSRGGLGQPRSPPSPKTRGLCAP